ncbi:MAG: 2-isopropylmalate synthase [Clostridiales bacterium 43-6]|nr:MAG: 2-isopropylmalate synthase [Clostridiales bacterium 43-6]
MLPHLNDKTGLLELGYKFMDVEKPNLFRNIYPYNEIPKLIFNQRIVPMDLPKEIFITDTTFRDGQQARSPYSVDEVVDLFTLLHKLDNNSGIIRQSEFFIYSIKNRDAVIKCQEKGFKFPEITAWIRAKKEDFQLVKDMKLKETGILVSCSDYHIFKKMKWTRSEALKNYLSIVIAALEAGVKPRCHFEDITRADFFGFVLPFAEELMKLMDQYKIPIKIRACDTLGLGTSIPGVVLPRSVPQIIYNLKNYSGVPSELLEWHGHNDFYNAVPNAVAAWLYGAASVNTSLLGIGERTGNTPLEAMCIEYCQLKGTSGGMDLKVITEISEYFEKRLNYQIPPRSPFVGRAFNSTRAGIHADGLLKDEEIYNIFDTTEILGRPPIVVVDATSGNAGIAAWINTYFSLDGEQKIDKNHECVLKIKKWIDSQYESGRNTSIGDLELENEVHKYYPDLLKQHESRIE